MHYELITKLQLAYVKPALLHNRHIMCRMKTLCMLGKCRLQFQHRLTMFLLSVVCASRIHIVLVRARSLVEAVQESPFSALLPGYWTPNTHISESWIIRTVLLGQHESPCVPSQMLLVPVCTFINSTRASKHTPNDNWQYNGKQLTAAYPSVTVCIS